MERVKSQEVQVEFSQHYSSLSQQTTAYVKRKLTELEKLVAAEDENTGVLGTYKKGRCSTSAKQQMQKQQVLHNSYLV